ncbi:MAG: D-alanyl-D-alanine carboxypeptidase family protein [Lysobacterales bacterium]
MGTESVTPAAGTTCVCTPDLVLAPEENQWLALNKANWQIVGQAKVYADRGLAHVAIAPEHQRQGFATQIRQAFPRATVVGKVALTQAAVGWLNHLGWEEKTGALPAATDPDLRLCQRERAARWTQALNIPSHYSQTRKLPLVTEPRQLQCLGTDTQGRAIYLTPKASQAWKDLRNAAADDGVTLHPVSGFRSIGYQGNLVRAKLAAGISMDDVLSVSAAPGYSEHHSGQALDLSTPGSTPLEQSFAKTPAFDWLTRNAKRWKFTMSYPENNLHKLAFEPWHWCFHSD